jgi:hypothetical protein
VADFAALRRAHAAGFAGGERRHVVVQHEAVGVSPISASIFWLSRAVPRVATTRAFSPRVNRAEPWVRGSTLVRIEIGRTVRVSRPSMRLAVQDLRTHDLRFHVEQDGPTSAASAATPLLAACSDQGFVDLASRP